MPLVVAYKAKTLSRSYEAPLYAHSARYLCRSTYVEGAWRGLAVAVEAEEDLAELGGHGAVQHEVDGVVHQGQQVHGVPQQHVHVVGEVAGDGAHDQQGHLNKVQDFFKRFYLSDLQHVQLHSNA